MQSCKVCQREYAYIRSKGHRKEICNSCLVDERRKKVTEKCLAYKGKACQVCGYDRCVSALEFHHVDPTTKEFQISGNWGLSWTRIQHELDKCKLVCANCHREIHAGLSS